MTHPNLEVSYLHNLQQGGQSSKAGSTSSWKSAANMRQQGSSTFATNSAADGHGAVKAREQHL
jgi:hypothetical protein